MAGATGRRTLLAGTAAGVAGAFAGCAGEPEPDPGRTSTPGSGPSGADPTDRTADTVPSTDSAGAAREPWVGPDDVRVRTAVGAVEHLAGVIGPRPGTAPSYFRAADWVQARLEDHGWHVERQPFRAPAGISWGVPVAAGRSVNLVATRGAQRAGRGWLAVGAHLDTVPQAPGAEDNASGVGVLLAVAEALQGRRSRLPVRLIAFGAEEPRGPTDQDHHYGSRAYVASLTPAQRRGLRGLVSLDRVGVGDDVVIGSVEDEDPLRGQLAAAARRARVPHVVESGQRSSDHWSFVRDGLTGVRLGSTPYAAYHSPQDVPAVVDRAQLERTARVVLAWLGRG